MRALAITFLIASVLVAQRTPPPKPAAAEGADPLFAAMEAEMTRARTLSLMGLRPYYYALRVEDAEIFTASAITGNPFAPSRMRVRPYRSIMRVGTPQQDNTGTIYSDFYNGTRYDPRTLPLDNQVMPMRWDFWLANDRAFKTAVEALSRKQAILRGMTMSETLPDFSPAPVVTMVRPPDRSKADESGVPAMVQSLSTMFPTNGDLLGSAVEYQSSQGNTYLLTSEGTRVRVPEKFFVLRARAATRSADGMVVRDGDSLLVIDSPAIPTAAQMRPRIDAVAKNVLELGKAPLGESYTGPVLFEPTAGAQVFAEVFGAQLGVTRRPLAEQGRSIPFIGSELEGRIGSRVLPEWIDVKDDPTLKEWQGTPLAGQYPVDLEGVEARPVTVVEKGVLKTLLTTRQPVKGVGESNGHARLPGNNGVNVARPGNLIVTAERSVPVAELKQRLIEMIKAQSKPYGMLIRKMDYPSTGSVDELRQQNARSVRAGGGGRLFSSPILAYRVYPDGREELVRGLRFRGMTARSFREILSASREVAVFNFVDNGLPMAITGAGEFVIGEGIVAPGLLFEDLEMEAFEGDLPKPPIVPPPSAQ